MSAFGGKADIANAMTFALDLKELIGLTLR
jgi:hypothetical protein